MSDNASAIKVPAGSALEKAISEATSVSEIQTLLHEAARTQGLIEKDPLDLDGKDYFSHHVVTTPQTHGFAKTLVIDGKKIILQSETEEGLVKEELNVMRNLFNKPAGAADQTRDEQGRFAARQGAADEAEAVRAAAVDPAAAALAPSVTAALEATGVSVAELRAYTQAKKTENYTAAWQQAGEQFSKSPEAADWAGGDNFQVMLDLIQSNPDWINKPSKETLALVWNHMKENGLVVENSADVEAREIADAQTPEQLQALLRSRGHLAPLNCGMWGGR
jgi:hypothetical protein